MRTSNAELLAEIDTLEELKRVDANNLEVVKHIDRLTAQVEELKAFVKRVAEADVETFHFNTQDGDTDCFEYTYIDVIEDANELLTRIGDKDD
jgi:hypothetical protein